VTREIRDHIRHERDRRARERAFENVCAHCLADLPEGGNPLQRFCGPLCRNANYSMRRRHGLTATPPGRVYQTDAERVEARRKTWRENARRRYAAQQGVTLEAWDAGKVAA
jgi:hypothetical protein